MSLHEGPWPARRSFNEFSPFSPTAWEDSQPPALDWIVEGAFLRGTVAILSGDGGLGKSLLLQQLITASWTGSSWLGMPTRRCRSLAVFCEDDTDELHRRQSAINEHYRCGMNHLEGVRMASLAGKDATIMRFQRWGAHGDKQVLFEQVETAAVQHKAEIIIFDTRADVFDGNEVDRNQPRTFIRELRRLAIKLQGVVIMTEHPSLEGMASGSGRSGSTGWNNSVRSRLYLTTPPKKKGDEEPPPNERVLRTMKNNQAASGGKIELVWRDGVFVRKDEQMRSPWYNDWQEND